MKSSFVLTLDPVIKLTDEQYYTLCVANPDLKLERNTKGELLIVSPTGGESGNRNIEISYQVQAWSRQNQELGLAFDSSTEFRLPTGAFYSPDTSWVQRDKWEALTPEQKRKFPPLAPDFVIELRSESDSLRELRQKMQDYMDAGVRLGWLIDPKNQQVEIYRSQQPIETLDNPEFLSGEDILPGFVFNVQSIFQSL
jgi:Uma2 family endonuclease